MPDQFQIIGDILSMLRRRFVLFAVVSLAGITATIYYAISLPRVYETAAVIQIESPQIPSELARSTVNEPTAHRIRLIEQELMSRDNVLAVIDKYDLFEDAPGLSAVERVGLMRESINLRTISDVRGFGAAPLPSALIVTVRLGDPEKAALVANELVTGVLERNARGREERARETLDFFQREEQRLSDLIAAVDEEMVAYKRGRAGSLPDGQEFRRDELTRVSENSDELRRQIRTLARERLTFENPESYINPSVAGTGIEGNLQQLQIELANRRQVLASGHPDIRRLEAEISALTSDRDRIREEFASQQIELIDQEIALLEAQLAANTERAIELNEMLNAMPEVESALSAFQRRREQLVEQYSAAVQSRSGAEIGQRLEVNRQAERFEILETALVPEYPVAPSRKKIVVLGSGASLGMAFVLVFLLDLLRPVLRTSGQMQRQLDIIPVVSLPYIPTPWENRRRKLGMMGVLLLLIIGLPASLVIINDFVMPLDEIAETYADRLPFDLPGS